MRKVFQEIRFTGITVTVRIELGQATELTKLLYGLVP